MIVEKSCLSIEYTSQSHRAMTVAARAAPVITVLGRHRKAPDGTRHVVIPKAAGYGITEVPDRSEPSGKRIVEEI